jgi:hypothetical protein
MKMNTEKTIPTRKSKAMDKAESEPVFYKDLRFWLALILAIALLYNTASNYPVLW